MADEAPADAVPNEPEPEPEAPAEAAPADAPADAAADEAAIPDTPPVTQRGVAEVDAEIGALKEQMASDEGKDGADEWTTKLKQLEAERAEVAAAEIKKLQEALDAAKAKIDSLADGEEKEEQQATFSDLETQLNALQGPSDPVIDEIPAAVGAEEARPVRSFTADPAQDVRSLWYLCKSEMLTDVTVMAGEAPYKAHSMVLASKSNKFLQQLVNPTKSVARAFVRTPIPSASDPHYVQAGGAADSGAAAEGEGLDDLDDLLDGPAEGEAAAAEADEFPVEKVRLPSACHQL